MIRTLTAALTAGIAAFTGVIQAATIASRMESPAVERIDISAPGVLGNRLAACRVVGQVTLWVSRPLEILDDMRESLGTIEAGLAQFSKGSKVEGCVPAGAALDLSDRFANFLIADDRPLREGVFGRVAARALASQLAQDFYHLVDPAGTPIPLVNGLEVSALGAVSYQFTVVLIRHGESASLEAVISRETIRTKFAPRLSAEAR